MEQSKIKAQDIWSVASERLSVHADLYNIWFSKLTPLYCRESEEGEILVLGVNDSFFAQIISENYNSHMMSALSSIDGVDYLY